jgi:hypothetical protein
MRIRIRERDSISIRVHLIFICGKTAFRESRIITFPKRARHARATCHPVIFDSSLKNADFRAAKPPG